MEKRIDNPFLKELCYATMNNDLGEQTAPLTNHPGWGRGKKIKLANGTIVECITDGKYCFHSEDGWDGYLWFYTVRETQGLTYSVSPMTGDTPIG